MVKIPPVLRDPKKIKIINHKLIINNTNYILRESSLKRCYGKSLEPIVLTQKFTLENLIFHKCIYEIRIVNDIQLNVAYVQTYAMSFHNDQIRKGKDLLASGKQ